MVDLRDTLELTTTNQAWGALLGVFAVFGRRLTLGQALVFAKALPPMLRAVFVAEQHARYVPLPFDHAESLDSEVADRHRDHQFAPAGAIVRLPPCVDVTPAKWRSTARFASRPRVPARFGACCPMYDRERLTMRGACALVTVRVQKRRARRRPPSIN